MNFLLYILYIRSRRVKKREGGKLRIMTDTSHLRRKFDAINDDIVQENTIRTLLASATNVTPEILAVQDARIASLRSEANFYRNSIIIMGGPSPGPVYAQIEAEMENLGDIKEPISDRERYKQEKKCVNCGVEAVNQCSICHKVRYCGVDCWRADRELHKSECKKG